MLARRLTCIACDAPFDMPAEGLAPKRPDLGRVNRLYDETGIGVNLRRQAERIADLY